MQAHEYYEELCALFPIGQLSAEEYEELAQHLRGCPSCRHATDDFSVILDKMPVGEAEVDEKTLVALQRDSYRDRFLKRAVLEGVPFSGAVMRPRFSMRRWSLPRIRVLAAFATAALIMLVLLSLPRSRRSDEVSRVNQQPSAPPAAMALRRSGADEVPAISGLEAKVSELEDQAVQREKTISEIKTKLSDSRAESESVKRELSRTANQVVQLLKEASDTQGSLDSAKRDLNRVRSEKDSIVAELIDQQIKINELNSAVKEKAALAERERQLTSVAQDIRELMGARNLHIVDVSDVDGNGRSRKSFGRVFLVEGKSLIFYAFDLGDRGNPAKVSFQAWGQLEGRQAVAKNLGVFYVDDHAQERWVLKVTDPEKLSAINSVFVTIEPLGGVNRPTGKKLLYAFLGTQANHP